MNLREVLKASATGATAFDDGSVDRLKGGFGRDRFIANRVGRSVDRLIRLAGNEWVDELS